jgi:phosphonate transport system substrate-binding protein
MDMQTGRRLAGAVLAALLAAQPAWADWKTEVGTLRIGMIGPAGAAIEGAATIEAAYAQALGLPVRIFVARDFAALIEAQARGRIDYAVYSATAYAAAEAVCGCVEPIAAPTAADGASGLVAVLIRRKAGGGAPASIVLARDDATAWLALAGAAPNLVGDAGMIEADGASAAEDLFVAGEAEALLGWAPHHPAGGEPAAGTLVRLAARGLAPDELELVWTSAPLRFGPHAVRSDLPNDLKDLLATFLAGLGAARPEVLELLEPHRQGRFARVSEADYAAARAIVERLAETDEAR